MRYLAYSLLFVVSLITTQATAQEASVTFGQLFYDGQVVRTLVPPSAFPHRGNDDLFAVTNGVEGQRAITDVAPGDPDYHGGQWAFHFVSFVEGVDPYLLTSSEEVLLAYMAGDIDILRVPEMDFRCPIQLGQARGQNR